MAARYRSTVRDEFGGSEAGVDQVGAVLDLQQEWAAALEESWRTFSRGRLYEVVQDWQGGLASAPAVDAFVASGYDDSDFIDMAELRGRRQ